jgi:hypothetical protein
MSQTFLESLKKKLKILTFSDLDLFDNAVDGVRFRVGILFGLVAELPRSQNRFESVQRFQFGLDIHLHRNSDEVPVFRNYNADTKNNNKKLLLFGLKTVPLL